MLVRRPLLAALTVVALAAPIAPAVAADGDPAPSRIGGRWLAGELEDGVLTRPGWDGTPFEDVGLTIDAGLALAQVGGRDADVAAVREAVARRTTAYTTGTPWGMPDSLYANETAKTLDFALATGADGRSFGGADLVDRLESMVATDAALAGRIGDLPAAASYDGVNVFGQAFAARALDAAGSPLADEVAGFLLQQQCTDGGFRLNLSRRDAEDQTCGAQESHPDATAMVVVLLDDLLDDPAVAEASRRALDWLAAQQREDGSHGGGSHLPDSNSNSTGLAAWAFGVSGRTERARAAATWLRRHQAFDPAPCTTALTPDPGAVAYDTAALDAGRADGGAHGSDQWRRASAQALPGLAWAPAASASLALTSRAGYVRAGSRQRLTVRGLAPAARACLAGPGPALVLTGADATQRPAVRLPRGTARHTYRLLTPSGVRRAMFRALDATTLRIGLSRRTIRRGAVQRIVVRGLAHRERVVVRVRGKVVTRGTASARGRFTARLRVRGRTGRAGVVATGQFADLRRGTTTYLVR